MMVDETPSLDELGLHHGTDKASSGHDYLRIYERHLAPMRLDSIAVIEIGVLDGNSLRMWSDFFPNATIVGVDVNEKPDFAGRIETVKGSQGDIEFLAGLGAKHRPSLVIDDGSHAWAHQIVTFQYLFPFLPPGGVYICEDMQTSFGGLRDTYSVGSSVSAAEFFQEIAEQVLAGQTKKLDQAGQPAMHYYWSRIESVTILRQAVVIQTKR